jgi:hypothetical protein
MGVMMRSSSKDMDATVELRKFHADFKKLLGVIAEKRRNATECSQIRAGPAPQGPDLNHEHLLTGEVCSSDELSARFTEYLRWIPIKLPPCSAIALYLDCGDKLTAADELTCARDRLYAAVEAAAGLQMAESSDGSNIAAACACARAIYGSATASLRQVLAADPLLKSQATLAGVVTQLKALQSGMQLLLQVPQVSSRESDKILQSALLELASFVSVPNISVPCCVH